MSKNPELLKEQGLKQGLLSPLCIALAPMVGDYDLHDFVHDRVISMSDLDKANLALALLESIVSVPLDQSAEWDPVISRLEQWVLRAPRSWTLVLETASLTEANTKIREVNNVKVMKPLYQAMSGLICAIANCRKSGNVGWQQRHTDHLLALVRSRLPSGSGLDCGTTIDLDASNAEKIVLIASFHHMDESGRVGAWTDHKITVQGSLFSGIRLAISGPNRNEIKDYLHDVFTEALRAEVSEPAE